MFSQHLVSTSFSLFYVSPPPLLLLLLPLLLLQDEIAEWVEAASMRLVTTFSPETSSTIFGGQIKIHMLYMADASHSSFEGQMETLTKVATKNKGKLLHVHVPHTEERVLQYFGAKEENLPMVVIADMTSQSAIKKYT